MSDRDAIYAIAAAEDRIGEERYEIAIEYLQEAIETLEHETE